MTNYYVTLAMFYKNRQYYINNPYQSVVIMRYHSNSIINHRRLSLVCKFSYYLNYNTKNLLPCMYIFHPSKQMCSSRTINVSFFFVYFSKHFKWNCMVLRTEWMYYFLLQLNKWFDMRYINLSWYIIPFYSSELRFKKKLLIFYGKNRFN